MITAFLFYTVYTIIALFTAWISFTVISANLEAHPKTRDLGLGWLAYPLASLMGTLWPVTILMGIIIAGVLK